MYQKQSNFLSSNPLEYQPAEHHVMTQPEARDRRPEVEWLSDVIRPIYDKIDYCRINVYFVPEIIFSPEMDISYSFLEKVYFVFLPIDRS